MWIKFTKYYIPAPLPSQYRKAYTSHLARQSSVQADKDHPVFPISKECAPNTEAQH